MATVTKPIALDESFNTTEVTPRNIADVIAEGLAHITGRTASEVEYDNTDSGLTADNVQDALDEIAESVPTLPSVDIQTAVDEFETYNGGLLSALKVKLSPNQDLHGYDSPWVGGTGKNLFYPTALTTTTDGVTFTNNGDGTYALNGTATADIDFSIESFSVPTPNVQYKMVGCPSGLSLNAFLQIRGTSWYDDGNGSIATTGDTSVHPVQIRVKNGATFNNVVFKPMFSLDTTITYDDFEPYENICPITGHTQVDVDVSDGQTTQEQITVNLGGTYYSGTLDVVSGELTVDSAFIASYNGETLPSTWISDRDVYAVGTTPTTGAEVCYKLATPTSIQLSPTMVKALVGENHLSAPLEGQEITESEYRELFTWDEVEAYVNAHSGGGSSGHNYSTTEQVIGTWIDGKPLYEKTIVYTPSGTMTGSTTIATIANAKVMRITEATGYNATDNRGYNLPDVRNNGGTKFTYDNGDVTLEIINDSWSSSWTFYVTVQYTKTTDT